MLTLLLSASLAASAPASPPPVAAPPPVAPPIVAPTAPPLPPIDPARLALARTTANALFRDGSVARMIDRVLTFGPNGVASSMLDMTLADVMGMAGQPLPTGKSPVELQMTFRQMMMKRDPYFQLTDMSRFFSSDSGRAFGDEIYLMWMDRAVFKAMMSTVPGLSAELPGAMQRVMAASARFPSPTPKPPMPMPAPKKRAPTHKK
ncbi:MAG: hypothetical protein LC656_01310 [Sphingomonadales bacterium]|nr:hypothetical protein [Sphingomonadales bacterium]